MGKHSLVKRALPGKNKKRSPVTVSLSSGRLLEFQQNVIVDPEVHVCVADCVDQVRSSFQQITVLRLADHPAVQALMTSHAHVPKNRFDTVVVDCVYHLTPEQQLRDVSAAAKAINKQNLQAINLKEKLKTEEARHGIPVAGPITRDIVVASSMYDHLLHVLRQGGPGFRFSLGGAGRHACRGGSPFGGLV